MRKQSILVTTFVFLVIMSVGSTPFAAAREDESSVELAPRLCPDFRNLSPWEQRALARAFNCLIDDSTDPITDRAPSGGPIPEEASIGAMDSLVSTIIEIAHRLLTRFPW